MKWSGITAKPREEGYYKGILPIMENILRVDRNPNILRFARTVRCSHCNGSRLNEKALSVKVDNKNISEFARLSISELRQVFNKMQFIDKQKDVGNSIREKLLKDVLFLKNLD